GTGPVADGRKQAQGLGLAQAHEDRDRACGRPRRPFHARASATSRVFQRTLLPRIRRAENQPEVLAGTLVLGLRYALRSGRVLINPDVRYAPRQRPKRWGNRPALLLIAEDLGAALQADGETRSPWLRASSIRRRSAAWTILLDWTYRSRRPASVLWM